MARSRILMLVAVILASGFFLSSPFSGLEKESPGIDTDLFPHRIRQLVHNTAHGLPVHTFRVVRTFPHDPEAFTQGLIYRDGFFYESTGLRGSSSVRQVDPDSGQVLRLTSLDGAYFGEGLAAWGDRLIQLTWKSGEGFLYGSADLSRKGSFFYPGEGWGLAAGGTRLILSDGSPVLRFLDPNGLKETGRMEVRCGTTAIPYLNDLEWVEGEILANIWRTDFIARISPETGRVLGWIDLTGLLPANERTARTGELNGIAYDAEEKRLFVTGKRWPVIFQIVLTEK